MSFDPSKYESQIRAILEAPDVDLRTVSAKRVRKQLQEQNAELTKAFVDDHKEELNAAIHAVFEKVQGSGDEGDEDDEDEDADEDGEPEVSTPVKRKRKDDGNGAPPKKGKAKHVSDEDLARQLQKELNGHRKARASSSAKTGRGGTKKGRKAKSAEVVNSDGEGSQDADAKPKRKGGFTKEYVLSEPLAALLGVDKLSRPQAVKQIWEHIKAKDLQAPEDRRDIVCDAKLEAIFSVKRINMFEMNKRLGEHLHTPPAPAA